MSRYNLRDVSERLTTSRTIEAVIAEFLRSLESMRSGWCASLAFYEVSQDALVDVYELDAQRLVRRKIVVPLDQLPHRLVQRLSTGGRCAAPGAGNGAMLSTQEASPFYLADERDASRLQPLTMLPEWQSCLCVPLAHQDDLIGLLVVGSAKKNAFAGKALGELVPIKSVATVALAQHLYRTARSQAPARPVVEPASGAAPAPSAPTAPGPGLTQEADQLSVYSQTLGLENRSRTVEIADLMEQIEMLDQSSSSYKEELERVKGAMVAMEEDSEVATEYLASVFCQLQDTQWELEEVESTVGLMRDAFALLAEEHDPAALPDTMVNWFIERFGLERCSLLVPDPTGETLAILAQHGLDPQVAARVRIRVGQGVAGWVAAHSKPLFVRVREDAQGIPRSPDATYNSDSFIVVPMAHNGRLHGVINLSNRLDLDGFRETDLDRAMVVASIFAVAFGSHQLARRSAAWA